MEKKVADSKALRELASELRKKAEVVRQEKMVKCAKYVVGMTALYQLQEKLKSVRGL
jgi:hypothetical protein